MAPMEAALAADGAPLEEGGGMGSDRNLRRDSGASAFAFDSPRCQRRDSSFDDVTDLPSLSAAARAMWHQDAALANELIYRATIGPRRARSKRMARSRGSPSRVLARLQTARKWAAREGAAVVLNRRENEFGRAKSQRAPQTADMLALQERLYVDAIVILIDAALMKRKDARCVEPLPWPRDGSVTCCDVDSELRSLPRSLLSAELLVRIGLPSFSSEFEVENRISSSVARMGVATRLCQFTQCGLLPFSCATQNEAVLVEDDGGGDLSARSWPSTSSSSSSAASAAPARGLQGSGGPGGAGSGLVRAVSAVSLAHDLYHARAAALAMRRFRSSLAADHAEQAPRRRAPPAPVVDLEPGSGAADEGAQDGAAQERRADGASVRA
ncbi:unnamed protein product [Prorocentrum cordatum]|uniref:Uncharacterized protein n=1 Tax=Prorocentrum cordatum TaxID=2364126 RepID=A0ABN9VJV6_9DINO|nr:unnamed protein product [Polarella glacialis]